MAAQYDPMLDKYRGDVHTLRQMTGSLGTSVQDVIETFQKPLEAGEPARRAGVRLGAASLEMDSMPSTLDMRDPSHPAHGRYRQAYAGVEALDRSMTRTPDGNSERLAAALTAASPALPGIAKVSLSDDGRYAFAFGGERDGGLQGLARVETAAAVRTPVEESTQSWRDAQLAQQTAEQTQRQHAQQQAFNQSGPSLA